MFKSTKPRAKRERSTTTVGHYVRNADLMPAIIEAKGLGKVTDKLIIMIQRIADRYSRKANFAGYSFREDMVAVAVENLCKNALKFNHEKYNNPFAFYTTAIHNSFLQFMADEKKHRNIRDALLIDAGSNPSFNFLQGEKDESHFEVKESDSIEFVLERAVPGGVDAASVPVSKIEEADPLPPETKIGYRDRLPSAVTRYGPGDFTVDEAGNITIKRVIEEPTPPKKKTAGRKKAVKTESEPAKTV